MGWNFGHNQNSRHQCLTQYLGRKTMNQQDFLRSLSNETRKKLTQRLDRPGLVHLALHLGLIVGFGSAIYLSLPGWQFLLIPQGIVIVFLFTLLHESVHQTPFRTKWLNNMTARVSGFLVFLPSTWFKYFHFAHHRFMQIPGKDPELATEKPKTTLSCITHISGIPTWVGHFKTLGQNAMGECDADFLPKRAEARIVKESRLLLLVYALILCGAIFTGSAALFWIWILPALLGQPFLRLYLLAEHGLCPTLPNMFENTRTTFTNRIVRFVTWNMSYHTEHHTYPSVPFHKLPDLHEIMQHELIHTEPSYKAFMGKYIADLTANNVIISIYSISIYPIIHVATYIV